MNFIRFENHAINVDNVAYVTRSDDNRVVLTFCAAKSESSLHLVLKGAGAEQGTSLSKVPPQPLGKLVNANPCVPPLSGAIPIGTQPLGDFRSARPSRRISKMSSRSTATFILLGLTRTSSVTVAAGASGNSGAASNSQFRGNPALLNPLRYIIPIPLPGLTIIRRKGLAPHRAVFIPRIPTKHDDNIFSLKSILCKKMSDPIFK